MGYDISSLNPSAEYTGVVENSDLVRFNIDSWSMLLSLAEAYGWKPAGSLPRPMYYMPDDYPGLDPESWDGSYFYNEGQVVTPVDAAALANALERALNDISDIDISKPCMDSVLELKDYKGPFAALDKALDNAILISGVIESGPMCIERPNQNLSPFEYFSGDMKYTVILFIALCRKGAFAIW